jgi:hypothetical protein
MAAEGTRAGTGTERCTRIAGIQSKAEEHRGLRADAGISRDHHIGSTAVQAQLIGGTRSGDVGAEPCVVAYPKAEDQPVGGLCGDGGRDAGGGLNIGKVDSKTALIDATQSGVDIAARVVAIGDRGGALSAHRDNDQRIARYRRQRGGRQASAAPLVRAVYSRTVGIRRTRGGATGAGRRTAARGTRGAATRRAGRRTTARA